MARKIPCLKGRHSAERLIEWMLGRFLNLFVFSVENLLLKIEGSRAGRGERLKHAVLEERRRSFKLGMEAGSIWHRQLIDALQLNVPKFAEVSYKRN